MNFLGKILLFSILLISPPDGYLFEIFGWNNRITRTETVLQTQRSGSGGRICHFRRIAQKIRTQISNQFRVKQGMIFRKSIATRQSKQLTRTLYKKTYKFKPLFIRRFIFNIIYRDDSGPAII